MCNSNNHLSPLPGNPVNTNLTQGSYRPFFFDLSEFALSKVEFNSVYYNEADAEAELINGNYSFAFIRQDKLRTIHAYDTNGTLLSFNSFLSRFHISIQSYNLYKSCKYLSRVFRQVRYGAFFNKLNVHINKNHNIKQTDGISLISVNLAKTLGWNGAVAGNSAQFTLFYSQGLIKGNCLISEKISSDVVIYGNENIKSEISLGNNLYYVALEPLKLSDNLRLDIQSLLNLWNMFGPEQYLSWAHTSIEKFKEDLVLGNLNKYLDDFDGITPAKYVDESWTLRKAAWHKVEYQRFPGLLRLGWTMLKNSIRTYSASKSGVPVFRIPVPGGFRGYLRCDLREHDEYGSFSSSLQKGEVELDRFGNLWMNPADTEEMLKILGGGDLDDSCAIIFLETGEACIFRNPNAYSEVVINRISFCGALVSSSIHLTGKVPTAIKAKDVAIKSEINKTGNALFDKFISSLGKDGDYLLEYNKENLLRTLINLLSNSISIGAVANAEMIRTSIGITNKNIHKMLMKEFPWNLERVIDSSIKENCDASEDMNCVTQMYDYILENNLEIPVSLIHRIPERCQVKIKRAKFHPVDQLFQALNMLINKADKDILGSGSVNMGNRIPGRIDYCNIPLIEIAKIAICNTFHDKAASLLKDYNRQIAILLDRTKDLPDVEVQRKTGINKIQTDLLKRLKSCNTDERTLIVNAWAYNIYKSSAAVHDSILWIGDQPNLPGTASDTINMLSNIGEAYHIKVKFGLVMERFQEYKEIKPAINCIRVYRSGELTPSIFADVHEIMIEDGSVILGDEIVKLGDEVKIVNGIYKVNDIVPAISKRDRRVLKNSLSIYINI